MTRWNEFPLRPQGQPWPGLNTRGGRLDPGTGQLEDGSINAIINEADILSKRKGFIRGLDERFTGPVCGLFRYTDDCGVEYLVVADQDGIHVRTPFDIPTFLGSDSLPNDNFEAAEVNTARWTNTDDYRTFLGSLTTALLAANIDATTVPESRLMAWFKAAAPSSYYVEIQYALVAEGGQQVVAVAIKRTGDSYLVAHIERAPDSYTVLVQLVQAGVATTLGTSALEGSSISDGFLRLSFNADSRVATCRVIPSGGNTVTITATLTEAQTNNLGQNSAVGIIAAELNDQPEILSVQGGALGS
jgi:hypothetical protein